MTTPCSRPRIPAPGEGFLLSVVMPVYNEAPTLEEIVEKVEAVDVPKEIIVVDDGSSDGTREILHRLSGRPGLRVIHHETNRGKGAALKTGFDACKGHVVVIQDADLEYDPGDFLRLLEPILAGEADVVYGSRFLRGEYAKLHHLLHYLGNRCLTWLSNVTTGLRLTDMETCYKAMRRELLDEIEIESRRFTVEPELTAKLAARKLRIVEVPINYSGRNYGEGKKVGWRDGFAAIWAICYYRWHATEAGERPQSLPAPEAEY